MPPESIHPEDLEHCRRILRDGSKSFALAALLLPRRMRDSATVLYAFCRVADDAIDSNAEATSATVATLSERLRAAYAGRPNDDPVDRALAVVVARERVPSALFEALIEGLSWDAAGRTYASLEELEAYAARVAGAVGAMMTIVMGERDPAVLARACDLGVAMQLTNIARDVGEDAARGRIYLPLEWMREAGIDVATWRAEPVADDSTKWMVSRLLRVADDLYARSDAGIPALPPDCRIAIRAARLIYSEIGRRIARAGFDSVNSRAIVSRPRKLWLLFRAALSRFERRVRLDRPPLDSTRYLVEACSEST